MLPGFRRTQWAPASIAFSASVWLKWMSAITGIGDSAHDRLERLDVVVARARRRARCRRPRRRPVRIWSIVAARLAVSVLVIVCTATGAPPPIGTPPTSIWRLEAIYPSWYETDPRARMPAGLAPARRGPAFARPLTGGPRCRPGSRAMPAARLTLPRARACAPRARRARSFRARRSCSRGCGSSTSAAARSACGRWSPSSTSPASTSRRRPALPGAVRAGRRRAGLPFADGEFDLAYCSSVIEHVAPARRGAFAAELRRVARGWYVQTPAWSFPVEPHALLPSRTGCRRRCAAPTGAWA